MGTEKGEGGGVDGFGGALGFGAAVDGEEVDAGVLDGFDEVYCLAGFVSLSSLCGVMEAVWAVRSLP